MTDIEFVDPPPSAHQRSGSVNHKETVAALKASPGSWARIETGAHRQTVTNIHSGALKYFRPVGAFEATSRRNGEGFDIYARYVGENGEHR